MWEEMKGRIHTHITLPRCPVSPSSFCCFSFPSAEKACLSSAVDEMTQPFAVHVQVLYNKDIVRRGRERGGRGGEGGGGGGGEGMEIRRSKERKKGHKGTGCPQPLSFFSSPPTVEVDLSSLEKA